MTQKHCPRCDTTKPLSSFGADRSRRDGLTHCCKNCRTQMTSIWSKRNPDRVRELDRRRRATPKRKEYLKKLRRKRYQETKDDFKFFYNIRRKYTSIIRRQTGERGNVIRYIGCTRDAFMRHIESLFKPGMSWSNYGKVWEIDHIIPFMSIDKADREAVIRLSHWTNTQPLFKRENVIKAMKDTNRFSNPLEHTGKYKKARKEYKDNELQS